MKYSEGEARGTIVESTLWLPQETAAVDKPTMHSILPQCQ
jgi:hypothetical protein